MRSAWFRHAFWNTLEQGLTRGGDALTSLVLIWALRPEVFSELVLAQAWVAPTLLVFLTPEAVIYRDLGSWQRAGADHVAARLRALRHFAWAKAAAALVATAALAPLLPGDVPLAERFAAVLWAYGVALGPQVAGADREYLRMELQLGGLNVLTVLQKSIVVVGTVLVAFLADGRFALLAGVAVLAPAVSGLLAWRLSTKVLRRAGATPAGLRGENGPRARETLVQAVLSYSLWQHLGMVLANWVRTMDLFFLGLVSVPVRELGLYGAAYKIANLSTALPSAVGGLFALWLGRRPAGDTAEETRAVARHGAALFAGTAVVAGALWMLTPALLAALSRGRWSAAEMERMTGWIAWLLASGVVLTASVLVFTWLGLRTSYARLFLTVSVPWTVLALVVYPLAVHFGGTDSAARVGVPVSAAFVVLAWLRYRRARAQTQGGAP